MRRWKSYEPFGVAVCASVSGVFVGIMLSLHVEDCSGDRTGHDKMAPALVDSRNDQTTTLQNKERLRQSRAGRRATRT